MSEPPATLPFLLKTPTGHGIHGLVDLPDAPGPRPTVVIFHGFKGFMEWGFFPHLAELLRQRGFVAVRANFSGGGMRPGEDHVAHPEAFRDNTFSRELTEGLALLEATATGALLPELAGRVDGDRLGLFGHSRGGGTAILAAASDPWRDRLRALVTWAAVSTFDRFDAATQATWRERGEIPIVNARTGQELPFGVSILEDLEENREALDIRAAARRRTAPWLLVHGAEDEAVPAEEGRILEAAAAPPVERLEIPGAGHTFGAKHPFQGPTPHLIEALNRTQSWLRNYLS
jgi:dienelactone hydrolase